MWEKGYVVGTAGNISAYLGDVGQVLITPSGAPYDSMTPDDIVQCDLAGQKLSGKGRPSSELPVHLAVYSSRPEVRAIVHTHSVYATAIAVGRTEIPFFLDEMYYVTGARPIPTAAYARSGTAELAQNIVDALGREGKGVLMANHGCLAVGGNIREAYTIAESIEKAAMILTFARLNGAVTTLG
jgi:L-fuculose-phosphate aldolase